MGVACKSSTVNLFFLLAKATKCRGRTCMKSLVTTSSYTKDGQYVTGKADFYALKSVAETVSVGNPLGLVTTRIAKRRF